jgi:hypothetical protein
VVPFFAVTVSVTLSPGFGPMKAESPGLSTSGGVPWPLPSLTNRFVGGASLFGSAPCSCAIVWQIWQLLICLTVRGRSYLLTTLKVCGPSCALLVMVSVPPDFTA